MDPDRKSSRSQVLPYHPVLPTMYQERGNTRDYTCCHVFCCVNHITLQQYCMCIQFKSL